MNVICSACQCDKYMPFAWCNQCLPIETNCFLSQLNYKSTPRLNPNPSINANLCPNLSSILNSNSTHAPNSSPDPIHKPSPNSSHRPSPNLPLCQLLSIQCPPSQNIAATLTRTPTLVSKYRISSKLKEYSSKWCLQRTES